MSNINETQDDYANYEYFRRQVDKEINKVVVEYSKVYCLTFTAILNEPYRIREKALMTILEKRDEQIASLNLKKDWLKGLIQYKYKDSDN